MEIKIHQKKLFEHLSYAGKRVQHREFEQCTFKDCDFSNSDFAYNRFTDCSFKGCNLGLMKLHNTTLSGCEFQDCKLIGINFSQCTDQLFSVGFEGCLLDYASFVGKKMPKTPFSKCSLKSADFSDATLIKALFEECELAGAVFSKTNLQEANLVSARNFTIDPELNFLRGAHFSQQGLAGLLMKYKIRVEH
jgi:fluoroquinolone resistance protein